MKQNDAIFQVCGHFGWVRDEVRAEVATIKLHTLDNFGLCLKALVLFDGNDAFIADLCHRVRDLLTDGRFAVGRNGTDFGNLSCVAYRAGHGFDFGDNRGNRFVDAAFQVHRVHTRSD